MYYCSCGMSYLGAYNKWDESEWTWIWKVIWTAKLCGNRITDYFQISVLTEGHILPAVPKMLFTNFISPVRSDEKLVNQYTACYGCTNRVTV